MSARINELKTNELMIAGFLREAASELKINVPEVLTKEVQNQWYIFIGSSISFEFADEDDDFWYKPDTPWSLDWTTNYQQGIILKSQLPILKDKPNSIKFMIQLSNYGKDFNLNGLKLSMCPFLSTVETQQKIFNFLENDNCNTTCSLQKLDKDLKKLEMDCFQRAKSDSKLLAQFYCKTVYVTIENAEINVALRNNIKSMKNMKCEFAADYQSTNQFDQYEIAILWEMTSRIRTNIDFSLKGNNAIKQ